MRSDEETIVIPEWIVLNRVTLNEVEADTGIELYSFYALEGVS